MSVTLLLSIFANDVLPIFVVAAVGFAIARVFEADVRTLSRVTFNALSPCLVFHLLVTSSLSAADFGRMTALALVTIVGIGLVARLVTLPFRLDRATTSAFLIVVMFSNSGNYGLPVVLFAFGRDALAHATVYFVVNAVATYTLGVFLASAGRRSIGQARERRPARAGRLGRRGGRRRDGVRRPPADRRDAAGRAAQRRRDSDDDPRARDAARAGRVAGAAGAGGRSPASSPWSSRRSSRSAPASVLGLTGAARQAAILQSGMPSAVLTTILALEFDVAPSFVTACVTLVDAREPRHGHAAASRAAGRIRIGSRAPADLAIARSARLRKIASMRKYRLSFSPSPDILP